MTVPTTPIYALPHEQGVTLPGRTLTGGPTGEDPILAEAVEAELERIDGAAGDLADEVERGWRPIASGTVDGVPSFTVDLTAGGQFPAGTFSKIRLEMDGRTSGLINITVRMNADDTSNLHQSSFILWDASLDGEVNTGQTDSGLTGTTARLGQWSTSLRGNLIQAVFRRTHESSRCPFDAVAHRQPTGAGNFAQVVHAWGSLDDNRLLSSLQIRTAGLAQDFLGTTWYVEGYRP